MEALIPVEAQSSIVTRREETGQDAAQTSEQTMCARVTARIAMTGRIQFLVQAVETIMLSVELTLDIGISQVLARS